MTEKIKWGKVAPSAMHKDMKPITDKRKFRVLPVKREEKKYGHLSVVMPLDELAAYIKAVEEERKATGMVKINASRIARKLIKKWVDYEVTV